MTKTVNITPLKDFVLKNFPRNSNLRELILSEKDLMSAEDFLAKSDLWFKLLRMEYSK